MPFVGAIRIIFACIYWLVAFVDNQRFKSTPLNGCIFCSIAAKQIFANLFQKQLLAN